MAYRVTTTGLRRTTTDGFYRVTLPHVAADESRPVFVLRATPFNAQLTGTIVAGYPSPLGQFALGVEGTWGALGAETSVYASDAGYVSRGSDTPAHMSMPPAMKVTLRYSEKVLSGDEPEGVVEGNRFSEIALLNGDGRFNSWLRYGWDGRTVEVLWGYKDLPFADFETVFKGTCDGISADWSTLSIRARGGQAVFDRLVDRTVYGGTGGVDGDASLQGLYAPLAYGNVFNAEPVLINESLLIYQIHDGPINSITEVRDKGIALTDTGLDAASYAALAAYTTGGGNDIEAGEFAVCTALGLIRLGGEPDGRVTVDVEGDASESGYIDTIGAITRRIITTRLGDASLVDPTGLDTTAFTQMETDAPYEAQLYIGSTATTVSDMIRTLLTGVAGWCYVNRLGLGTIGLLKAPTGSQDHTIYNSQVLRSPKVTRSEIRGSGIRQIGYMRNWTPQDPDSLAGAVSAADRRTYSEEYRYARTTDTSMQSKHLIPRDLIKPTCIFGSADAATEASRQKTLYSTDRFVYAVPWKGEWNLLSIGDEILWEGANALGLGSSTYFRLVGMDVEVQSGIVKLYLFG